MEIMVDLETLGVKTHSKILTLAAIAFDINNNKFSDCYYERVDLQSYDKYPNIFTVDKATLDWWNITAPKAAREEAFNPANRKPIDKVLLNFAKWCQLHNVTKIWSHGASFDISIISYAMSILNIEIPWNFWNIRDTRTLYDLAGVRLKYINCSRYPEHHAIGDCERQIEALKISYRILFNKK